MHAVLQAKFPDEFKFLECLPATMPCGFMEMVLRRCLRTLLGKTNMNSEVQQFFDLNVLLRDDSDVTDCIRVVEDQAKWFKAARRREPKPPAPPRPPKPPPALKRLMPKPKGMSNYLSYI